MSMASTVLVALATIAMQPAATAPSRPATASAVATVADPAALTKAEHLLDLIHLDRQYDLIFAQITPVMTTQVFTSLKDNVQLPMAVREKLADPAEMASAERIFAEEVTRGFKARYGAMRAATAREYAAVFTADELDQLSAFYQSPVGQKTLAVQPELQGKLVPIGMAAGAEVGRAAMARTFERLKLAPEGPQT